MWGLGPKGKGGAWSWLDCWLLGTEDLLCGGDQLVWDLTSRTLRTCGGESLRVLQLMQKLWCFSRAVYQVGPAAPLYVTLQHMGNVGGRAEMIVTCLGLWSVL